MAVRFPDQLPLDQAKLLVEELKLVDEKAWSGEYILAFPGDDCWKAFYVRMSRGNDWDRIDTLPVLRQVEAQKLQDIFWSAWVAASWEGEEGLAHWYVSDEVLNSMDSCMKDWYRGRVSLSTFMRMNVRESVLRWVLHELDPYLGML